MPKNYLGHQPAAQPLRIGLLLFEQCMPAGLFSFADLLNAANRRTGQTLFETRFVALEPGPVACSHGMLLTATGSVCAPDLDAVLVPGFWAESPQQVIDALSDAKELVRALAALPKKIGLWSYCTGVGLLAASGKLNGQPATATWWLMDTLIVRYTKVAWQSEQTCVVNLRNATASGVNGHLPIAQAAIERYVSKEVFRDLTKLMVLPRPERTHFVFQAFGLMRQSDELLRKLHMIVERMPAAEVSVQRLAAELKLSERTLARKIESKTGFSVAAYARNVKLNQASERLILTSMPASTISAELGFSSDSGMRRMFKQLTNCTPLEYRQLFGRHAALGEMGKGEGAGGVV
ncbi:GlxA family transcriptional regulator [Undibacterium sp.]|uniref:GlxA family transcriptional regulator n=1 Tax=Undibacterium sp. TaxID=1914977 RepID=UPI002D0EF85E|nr:helix-turn-helix domain-containing protein [Undibacterium sp.]HTD05278.1 helix-turn-helix domain-containing protein [Undibacterium sp.]